MTAIEIKTQLHQMVDHIPENALQQALTLLKELSDASDEKSKRRAHIDLILEEDLELLKMLAK